MAEALAGTAYARARWHALRRGAAAATWARKPDLAYYKWWGRWQSTAVAMQYGTKWSHPGVVAPTVLPAWSRDRGPLPTPERVGVLALWSSPMFPNIAGALSTPTKRKPRRPRGEGPGTTEGGTVGSGDDGDQAATKLEEPAEDGPAEMGPEPEAAPTPPPLQSLAPASERGAVSREDAGQLCTLAGPLVAVGGGGGCGPGTATGAHQCRFRRGHRRRQRGFRKRTRWRLRSRQRQGFPRVSTDRNCQVRWTRASTVALQDSRWSCQRRDRSGLESWNGGPCPRLINGAASRSGGRGWCAGPATRSRRTPSNWETSFGLAGRFAGAQAHQARDRRACPGAGGAKPGGGCLRGCS